MNDRALSIDALRGYAIITMVLSATIVTWLLPDWMSHAQTPPPDHAFRPDIPGITWVDMVFPSFLFAMGAALPFSIGRRLAKGAKPWKLAMDALWRGIKLAFFAILIQHFYPYMLSSPQDLRSWLMAIFCFALLFPMFMRLPWNIPSWARTTIQLGAMAAGTVVMVCNTYADGQQFSLYTSNIIILILANVAVFSTLLYLATTNRPKLQLIILVCIAGLFLSADANPSSWQNKVLDFSPAPWLYNAHYLKYLFVVMPGCYAGQVLAQWLKNKPEPQAADCRFEAPAMIMLTLLIVISNLYFLFTRRLELNLLCSAVGIIAGFVILRKKTGFARLWRSLFAAGAAMLIIGLCWEAYEGGIKKDPVTFSYLFVTAGLSFITLIFFSIICDYYRCNRSTAFLVLPGQNPMMAYVANDLLIFPILQMTGIINFFGVFAHSPLGAFMQGVVLTALAVAVTMLFTRLRCIWRT